jgi:hypothetical protein
VTIFDLLFLLAALSLLIALVTAAVLAIRGKLDRARAIGRRIGIATATYFAAIVVVSIASPRQVTPIGVPQCFDDWCITALRVEHQRAGVDDSLRVALQLSSRARGISQGERDVRVYLIDDRGRRYLPAPEAGATPLSTQIPPEGSVAASRLFLLPADARHPMLIVAHDAFPHCCIIADRESLLHRQAVVPLD